eukprot:2020949-Prymnesium_polylepis.1
MLQYICDLTYPVVTVASPMCGRVARVVYVVPAPRVTERMAVVHSCRACERGWSARGLRTARTVSRSV